jgi:hypothetical protein
MSASGTSNLPAVLPYPNILNMTDERAIKGMLVYVIKHYGKEGISIIVTRDRANDTVYIMFSDWCGNKLDLNDGSGYTNIALKFASDKLNKLIELMYTIALDKAQFYFTIINNDELMLVDVRISINKFLGPGFIRDLFSKILTTQEIIKIENIDDRFIEYVNKGIGSYEGNLIIKPSVYRTVMNGNKIDPYYLEMVR